MGDRGEPGRDVGQLSWVGFQGTTPPEALTRAIGDGRVGAVVLFRRNIAHTEDGAVDVEAVIELTASLHAAAPPGEPLLIAVDQEGGRVQRIKTPATVWPPMLCLDNADAQRAIQLAYSTGEAMGNELAALGIDIDFAPVLDVHTNPANPIIGDRAFGTDATAVANRALAFARGLAAAGVLACGKHFPGHGDTVTDSHLQLPRIDHDLARLHAVELAPFARAADALLPMIMTAHVVFAAIDADRPATLSRAVVGGVLRDELGYQGVVVSDDLDMGAIRDHYGAGEAAVMAIVAGCDALLLCADEDAQREAFDTLVARAAADAAVRARVAEAADAVRALKRRYAATRQGIAAPSVATALSILNRSTHELLAGQLRELAR